MHRQMSDVMKKMGRGGMLKQAMRGMFGKGADLENFNPKNMDAKDLEKAAKQLGEAFHREITRFRSSTRSLRVW